MIEMQWVTAPLQTPGNVGVFKSYGTLYKLQFREVRTVTNGSTLDGGVQYTQEVATDWRDVEVEKTL